MSRAGYSYDLDTLEIGRWRAQVKSAMRGQRGQAFFKALVEALDAMPEKKLVQGDLQDESGCVCALGALGKHRGVDLETLDTYDYEELGKTFNIAHQLAQETMYENDEGAICFQDTDGAWKRETPERRWQRLRDWATSNLRADKSPGAL